MMLWCCHTSSLNKLTQGSVESRITCPSQWEASLNADKVRRYRPKGECEPKHNNGSMLELSAK